jgi:hypothetical protein
VIADRLLVAALQCPDRAETAERACLAETVAGVTEDSEGLLLMAGGLLVAAQLLLNKA